VEEGNGVVKYEDGSSVVTDDSRVGSYDSNYNQRSTERVLADDSDDNC